MLPSRDSIMWMSRGSCLIEAMRKEEEAIRRLKRCECSEVNNANLSKQYAATDRQSQGERDIQTDQVCVDDQLRARGALIDILRGWYVHVNAHVDENQRCEHEKTDREIASLPSASPL